MKLIFFSILCLVVNAMVIPLTVSAETLLWKLDFENGFNATGPYGGGTIDVVGGNISDPYNSGYDVHVLYDTSLGSNVLQMGKPTSVNNCRLTYNNMDPNVLGKRGKLTLRFKVDTDYPGYDPENPSTEPAYMFNASSGTGTAAPYWLASKWNSGWIGVESYSFIVLESCYGGQPRYPDRVVYATEPMDPVLEEGWHDYELIWSQTRASVKDTVNPSVFALRELADLRITIDNDPCMTFVFKDALWTPPGNPQFNVGCFTYGNTSGIQRMAGATNTLLDDICVWSYEPISCDDIGTIYLDGDINEDCAVTFKDFSLLGENWVRCNDPNNPVCQ